MAELARPAPAIRPLAGNKTGGPPTASSAGALSKAIMHVHHSLLNQKNLPLLQPGASTSFKDFELQAAGSVKQILKNYGSLFTREQQTKIMAGVYSELYGLGPLDELLSDASVTEIMVNSPSEVFIERQGKLTRSETVFFNEAHVRRVVDAIVSRIGRRIDENSPLVDARLPDGSRFNAVIPPLALKGSTLTIRKFSRTPFTIDDLVRFGSLTGHAAAFLKACVVGKLNVVISGGTGSGKTTLLNVLSSYIPEHERVITVEDAAELKLNQAQVISLESRPAPAGGRGSITIRDLIRNALRMRPDRIVVGECRGGEALDMLQAMNTGHAGSMTTGHANSPADILKRIETMVLMSGLELPVRAIREQMVSAISLIVQQSRFHDGTRKVSHITELVDMDEDATIHTRDLFRFRQTGLSPDGKILGMLEPTGALPDFLETLSRHGVSVPKEFFSASADPHSVVYALDELGKPESLVGQRELALLDHSLQLHRALIEHGQAESSLENVSETQLRQQIQQQLLQLQSSQKLTPHLSRDDREQLITMARNEVRGYGPLTPLLEQDGINEIFVNGPAQVLVREHGILRGTAVCFRDAAHMRRIISTIVAPLGRRCDDSMPMVDARLPDGSGFNAILPPLSLLGPVITVRKFSKEPYTAERFLKNHTWDAKVCDFLGKAVAGKLNVVVFGGTGTGKTTLLNVLSQFISDHDRIITMESIAELKLQQTHVVALETRSANAEGSGAITMQDLVRNALRMRPERILIGEITSGEALDMLQAMNTGHDGSMCTGHANTPEDMISRMETLVLMSGYELPIKAIREQIASAVDLLVHIISLPSGGKRIASVTEVADLDPASQRIQLFPLFTFQPAASGQAERFCPSGRVPSFLEKLRLNGIKIDDAYFKDPRP